MCSCGSANLADQCRAQQRCRQASDAALEPSRLPRAARECRLESVRDRRAGPRSTPVIAQAQVIAENHADRIGHVRPRSYDALHASYAYGVQREMDPSFVPFPPHPFATEVRIMTLRAIAAGGSRWKITSSELRH